MRRRGRVKLFNYINGTNGPLLAEQVNTWIERIERDFPGFQIDRSHYRTWRTKDDDGDTRDGDTMKVGRISPARREMVATKLRGNR